MYIEGECVCCVRGSMCVEGRVYAVKKGSVRGSMYVEGNVSWHVLQPSFVVARLRI